MMITLLALILTGLGVYVMIKSSGLEIIDKSMTQLIGALVILGGFLSGWISGIDISEGRAKSSIATGDYQVISAKKHDQMYLLLVRQSRTESVRFFSLPIAAVQLKATENVRKKLHVTSEKGFDVVILETAGTGAGKSTRTW